MEYLKSARPKAKEMHLRLPDDVYKNVDAFSKACKVSLNKATVEVLRLGLMHLTLKRNSKAK